METNVETNTKTNLRPQAGLSVFKLIKKDIAARYQLYLLVLLPFTYVVVFHYLPIYGLQIAFKDFIATKGITGSPWVGFKHFEHFFTSPSFGVVLRNTLFLTLYGLVIGFPIPIILALAFNITLRPTFRKTVQMITYAPHFISVVVLVGMLYQFLSPKFGIVNQVIHLFGGTPVLFMGSEKWFRHLYVWSDIWQNMGWSSILYISVLTTVDWQQHEAAIMDGASRFKRVLYVDLPALIPVAVILLILNTGYIMSVGFEKIYLMQNTSNLATSEVISTYLYKLSFLSSLPNYSYSTAIGFFNSIINFAMPKGAIRESQRRRHGPGFRCAPSGLQPSPPLRAQAKQSMARQAKAWIASSLPLLAMTAENIRSLDGALGSRLRRAQGRNPGIAAQARRPRISLRSIRATPSPSLRAQAKQSMARQAETWIASSLPLLAMTAENIRSLDGALGSRLRRAQGRNPEIAAQARRPRISLNPRRASPRF